MSPRRAFVLAFATVPFVLCLCAPSAEAQVTSARWVNVDNTIGDVPDDDFDPSQYVTNDLVFDFTGRFSGTQLLLELTSGSIYQNMEEIMFEGESFPVAGNLPVPEALLELFPAARFDTFLAFGGPTSGDTVGNFGAGSGAVGMGGEPRAQFDSERINQAWNPAGGVEIFDQSDFMVARVTLSSDAVGEWGIKTAAGGGIVRYYGAVDDGRIFLDVPGDYDANAFVGQGDLDQILLNWGKPAESVPKTWFSNPPKGLVSQNELDAVLLNWGGRYVGQVTAVAIPEPGALAIALIAIGFIQTSYSALWRRPSRVY